MDCLLICLLIFFFFCFVVGIVFSKYGGQSGDYSYKEVHD